MRDIPRALRYFTDVSSVRSTLSVFTFLFGITRDIEDSAANAFAVQKNTMKKIVENFLISLRIIIPQKNV